MRIAAQLGLAIVLCGCAGCTRGADLVPDYAREERWLREIIPAIVVGDPVYLATPRRERVLAIFTEPERPQRGTRWGVVVIHGLGVHPDWGLINGLRTGLADAGFASLSVQMPVLAADASREAYAPLYAEAGERIGAAVRFLRERGIDRVAIVSHSLGAAMANAWLAATGTPRIDAWIPVGMPVAFAVAPAEPVLDVIAESDFAEVRAVAPHRADMLEHERCSRQIVIAATDHYMANRQRELVVAITSFLSELPGRDC